MGACKFGSLESIVVGVALLPLELVLVLVLEVPTLAPLSLPVLEELLLLERFRRGSSTSIISTKTEAHFCRQCARSETNESL